MTKKHAWTLAAAALAAVLAYRSAVFVDETEFVIVTQFGRPVETLRDAGLHWKWPWRSALRVDRRLQIYDPKPSEFSSSKKEPIDLDVFVCWRVADPQRFIETVNDAAGAEARLHDIVWSELAAAVGRHTLEAFVSVKPEEHQLDELMYGPAGVAARCAERAKDAYGIEVADVRIKRIGVPEQVRPSVFQRMRTERASMAKEYRAEGEEQATKIRADADKNYQIAVETARAEATRIQGAAEAEAMRIYADAHRRNPEFFRLSRTLEAYRKFLDDKTTMLLSGDSPLFQYLNLGAPAPASPQPKTTHGR